MPMGFCTWCTRSRLVELQTWRSPKSGEQLCGEVCGHCFYGTGGQDDCRTCQAKGERAERLGQSGVRPLGRDEVLELLWRKYARHDKRA